MICGNRRYKTSILTKARLAQWTEPPEVKMHASMTSMRAEVYHCDGKETRVLLARAEVSIAQLGHGTAEIPLHPVAGGQGGGSVLLLESVWDTPLDEEETHMTEVPVRIVRARDLAKADTFGLSDPYCVVKWREAGSGEAKELGRTETKPDTLNPFWSDALIKVQVPHAKTPDGPAAAVDGGSAASASAGAGNGTAAAAGDITDDGGEADKVDEAHATSQEDELLIEVWDEDPFGAGDFLGQTTIPASVLRGAMPAPTALRKSSALIECTELTLEKQKADDGTDLTKGQEYVQGTLTVILGPAALTWRPGAPMNSAPICDLMSGARPREARVRLMIVRANGLANADMFGKSDPFVVVTWRGEQVLKTATVNDTLDPEWTKEEVVLSVPLPTDGVEPVAEPDPETSAPSTPMVRIELFDEDPMSSTFMGEAYLSTEELLHPPWHDVSRPLCVKEADSSDETDKETEKANRVVQGTITISWCFEPLAVAELDPPEPPPGAEDTQDGPLHEVMFADDVDAERERLRPLAEKDKMFPVVNQLMATVEARARAVERGELVSDEGAEGGRASVAGGSKGRILPEIQRGQLISMFERKMRLTILHGSPLRLVIPFHDRQDDDEGPATSTRSWWSANSSASRTNPSYTSFQRKYATRWPSFALARIAKPSVSESSR